MSYVMATCDACGRLLSAARHPEPSGANPRRKRHRDTCAGPRLLETGSPKTNNQASATKNGRGANPRSPNKKARTTLPGPINASTLFLRYLNKAPQALPPLPQYRLPSPAWRERVRVRVTGADKRAGHPKQPQPIIPIIPNHGNHGSPNATQRNHPNNRNHHSNHSASWQS